MNALIAWMENLAQHISVTWFVAVGALVEEVLAPIPSPLVMTLAGSIASEQGRSLSFILLLALIGALSKTFGSFLIYILADKMEDVIIDKFGKFLGISHSDTEGLGKYLGKGKRDDVAVFLMRAIPIIPTAPVSVIAGIIKINLKTYLLSTFFGLILRNSIYLYFGFTSVEALHTMNESFDSLEKIGYFILAVIGGITLLWMYRKRQQGSVLPMIDRLMESGRKMFSRKK